MKVREMTGLTCDPRPDVLEYDQDECDRYVKRIVADLTADIEEIQKAEKVHEVHNEICSRYDLYIAVNDALGSRYRSAFKAYLQLWKSR
jgi:hypothetical protein